MKTKVTNKKFTLLGVNGVITDFIGPSATRSSFRKTKCYAAPTVTIPTYKSARLTLRLEEEKDEKLAVREWLNKWYAKKKAFGPYGDMMRVSRVNINGAVTYTLDFFGHLSFPQPSLASDLLIFAKKRRGQVYVIGIIRKEDPGKGCFAPTGGFRNIIGYRFESGLEAALREAHEEAGVKITISKSKKLIMSQPYPKQAEVTVKFADGVSAQAATVQYIGSFFSSDEEKLLKLHKKRVDETAGYAIMLDLPVINKEIIKRLFQRKDDAKAVKHIKIEKVKFSVGHHETLFQAARLKLNI